MKKYLWNYAALLLVGLGSASCNFDDPVERESLEATIQPFFNAPGTRAGNERNRLSSEFIVQQFDEAKVSLDLCTYGLSKQNIIDAAIRAHKRGVKVRVVGDARHLQYNGRSEERRVGKECRSRWSPYD